MMREHKRLREFGKLFIHDVLAKGHVNTVSQLHARTVWKNNSGEGGKPLS